MTWAYVDGALATNASGTIPATTAIDTTGANFAVVNRSAYYYSISQNQTDFYGNIYTCDDYGPATANQWDTFGYCANPTVGSAHTFTAQASNGVLAAMAFSGAASSSVLDQNTDATSSTTPVSAHLTPNQADSLFVAAVNLDPGVTGFSSWAMSGFTNAVHSDPGSPTNGTTLQYQVVAGTGQTTASFSSFTNFSTSASLYLAVFKPGAGGSTVSATGTATGAATASGASASIATATGTALAGSTALGVVSGVSPATGTATGVASALGAAASIASVTGTAIAAATAFGAGASIASATGTAIGAASATGVTASIPAGAAVGTAIGISSALGIAASVWSSTGTAIAGSSALGVVNPPQPPITYSGYPVLNRSLRSRSARVRSIKGQPLPARRLRG